MQRNIQRPVSTAIAKAIIPNKGTTILPPCPMAHPPWWRVAQTILTARRIIIR